LLALKLDELSKVLIMISERSRESISLFLLPLLVINPLLVQGA